MQEDIKKAVERHRNALFITAVAGEPTTLTFVYPLRGFLVRNTAHKLTLVKETRPQIDEISSNHNRHWTSFWALALVASGEGRTGQ